MYIMAKNQLTKPTVFLLYGFPGSGKTHFARQFCAEVQAAHLQDDRIRSELFESPRHDKKENSIVTHLTQYMAEEFLSAGVSVVLDVNVARARDRHFLRELARRNKAHTVLVWFQMDADSAFSRISKRDRRKADDKYSPVIDRQAFNELVSKMQNPTGTEDYIVVSGKHTFSTQRSAVIKRLYELSLIQADQAVNAMAMPSMVNLVPNPSAGRVDPSRRNISIY
jgi:predicted kinase